MLLQSTKWYCSLNRLNTKVVVRVRRKNKEEKNGVDLMSLKPHLNIKPRIERIVLYYRIFNMDWNVGILKRPYKNIGVSMCQLYSVVRWMLSLAERKEKPSDCYFDQWKPSCAKEIQNLCSKN